MGLKNVVSVEVVATKIQFIRGKRVMLDQDLALLYGVSTKVLNQAVQRHRVRFLEDFMFRLTKDEALNLKSQFVTSRWGGIRKLPHVFTEQGVAMLSGVLNSSRAIQVNIAIMRAFVKLKELLLAHKELADKVTELEEKVGEHDESIGMIFEAIKKLLEPPSVEEKRIIGFAKS
ncbi:MAG TPA: ORF6N domain-containing protein [Candidatus Omnitrophota bacterium]|nr:ORF6N domain-containing protein [Candidatus Omnitrophota bacterium]